MTDRAEVIGQIADGYYEDAYDFDAFARLVLTPLGPGGDRRYHRRVIDLAADTPVSDDVAVAVPEAILVIDGSFLQRPELVELWDCVIYLDTSLAVARQRGAARYLAEVHPAEHAHLRMENDNLARPSLLNQHFPGE